MTSKLQELLDSTQDLDNQALLILADAKPSVLIRSIAGPRIEKLVQLDEVLLPNVIETLSSVGKDFGRVAIISTSPQVTCIPDGIYEEQELDSYLETVFGVKRGSIAMSRSIPELSLHCAFRMDSVLHEKVAAGFPQAETHHLCESLLIDTWSQCQHDSPIYFRVHQQSQDLFIQAFEGKQLVLFTHHRIGDPTDVVYHCLNTFNLFEISPTEAFIGCSGALHSQSEGMNLLHSYCPKANTISASFHTLKSPEQVILASPSYCA